MSFITALSGLNAAANNLAVTGNNIANANTTGFKRSRSEFADVYSASLGGVSNITPGSGVKVANVAQLFNQGNLEFTENNLDLGISGEGFFTLGQSPTEITDLSYTRSGEFKLDKDGFMVNNQGKALLVYRPNGPDVSDGFSSGVTQPVQINNLTGLPSATDEVELTVNLDADAPPIVTQFDYTDNDSYTSQTSATIYDSFGTPHILTTYFANRGPDLVTNDPTWHVYHYMTELDRTDKTHVTMGGVSVDVGTDTGVQDPITSVDLQYGILTFDSGGQLSTPADGKFDLDAYVIAPATGAADIDLTSIDYFGSTSVTENFSVNALTQDGLPAGRLVGIDIDDEGVVFARFSNGGSQPQGKVALTRFANVNGLSKLGDTAWGESSNSGEPILGDPGANGFGLIQSGALEASNVDIAAQLVNLIVAQQAYQANAQAITTENTIIQTILNI